LIPGLDDGPRLSYICIISNPLHLETTNMAPKPGIGTASKKAKTQGRLAQAIEAKAESKPKMEFAKGPFVGLPNIPDYTPEVQEIADSLRHIHSTLHILSTALLAWTQRDARPVVITPGTPVEPRKGVEFPVAAEAPGVTPLGEVKPRRGRPAKVKEPVPVEVTQAAAEVIAETAVQAVKPEEQAVPEPAKVEAVPEKPKSFEDLRAAAIALVERDRDNGRARLTAILQAEAGAANLSGVPAEKIGAVVKALTEATRG